MLQLVMSRTNKCGMLKARMFSNGQITIPKAVLRKIVPKDWRRWGGRFPNSGTPEALQRDHQHEVIRDA
jgi:hypothetical protein